MLRLVAVLAVASACAPSAVVLKTHAAGPLPEDAAPRTPSTAPLAERAARLAPPFEHASGTRRVATARANATAPTDAAVVATASLED